MFILGQIKHILEVAQLHIEIRFCILPDQTSLLTYQTDWKIVHIYMRVNPCVNIASRVVTNQPVVIKSPDESLNLQYQLVPYEANLSEWLR